MKILSWNIRRPKIVENRNSEIIRIIKEFDADIIFLTETNSIIDFPTFFKIQTKELPNLYNGIRFSKGENQTTIFSKYKIEEEIVTYDNFSSVCGRIETEYGKLILYGSIIGFTGGKNDFFKNDFEKQKVDIEKLGGNNLCFSGDLNISFSGFPYPSKKIRNEMLEFCDLQNLEIVTKSIENSAIHIIFSKDFLKDKSPKIVEEQIETKISDHNLIFVEI